MLHIKPSQFNIKQSRLEFLAYLIQCIFKTIIAVDFKKNNNSV